MDRTLHLSRRPFIILGICLSPAIIPAGYAIGANALRGDWREALQIFGVVGLLIAFVFSQLWFTKIRVSEDRIVLCGWLGKKQSILFSNISFTKVNVGLEKDWPLSIDVFCSNHTRPAMTIKSKLLARADIAWLLSLPSLKVRD